MLQLFALISSCFAMLEKLPTLTEHQNKTQPELFTETLQKVDALKIIDKIQGFTAITDYIAKQNKQTIIFGLLILDTKAKTLKYIPYPENQPEKAFEKYTEQEDLYKNHPEKQVLLVKIGSIQQLKRAYPNYFANLKDFCAKLKIIQSTLTNIESK